MFLMQSDDQDFPMRVRCFQRIPLLSFSVGGGGGRVAGPDFAPPHRPCPPAVLGGRITHNRDPLIMSFGHEPGSWPGP